MSGTLTFLGVDMRIPPGKLGKAACTLPVRGSISGFTTKRPQPRPFFRKVFDFLLRKDVDEEQWAIERLHTLLICPVPAQMFYPNNSSTPPLRSEVIPEGNTIQVWVRNLAKTEHRFLAIIQVEECP
jgi:hypothetical protein